MIPEILFEDDALVVINKPSGMVSNKSQTIQTETVQDWFAEKIKDQKSKSKDDSEFWQKGGLVHRLDKDTSGVMVLAKTEGAYDALKQQFLERKTTKIYEALVHGQLTEDSGLITAPIERHPKDRHKFTVGGDLARSSITEWKVLSRFSDFTLLELTPHTGRTHQLRVHLQHIHHPIVSDPIYGFAKRVDDDLAICPRLFLHAKYLEFLHPISQKRVHFSAPLPLELESVLKSLLH